MKFTNKNIVDYPLKTGPQKGLPVQGLLASTPSQNWVRQTILVSPESVLKTLIALNFKEQPISFLKGSNPASNARNIPLGSGSPGVRRVSWFETRSAIKSVSNQEKPLYLKWKQKTLFQFFNLLLLEQLWVKEGYKDWWVAVLVFLINTDQINDSGG